MIFFWNKKQTLNNLEASKLFDETSFYKQFIADLLNCKKEVIIESPYITSSRMELLTPIIKKLVDKGIKIHIITRDPIEHDEHMQHQATAEILNCSEIGVNITLLRGNHHRKLAIIDRKILWEGSLNILSQNNSREIMRRIEKKALAIEMLSFLNLQKVVI
jgi:phosphatidylserine/phosphatidylglycerophosphate/cardiolipin synthase-like enzyme